VAKLSAVRVSLHRSQRLDLDPLLHHDQPAVLLQRHGDDGSEQAVGMAAPVAVRASNGRGPRN